MSSFNTRHITLAECKAYATTAVALFKYQQILSMLANRPQAIPNKVNETIPSLLDKVAKAELFLDGLALNNGLVGDEVLQSGRAFRAFLLKPVKDALTGDTSVEIIFNSVGSEEVVMLSPTEANEIVASTILREYPRLLAIGFSD